MDDDREAYLEQVLIGGREPAAISLVDYDEQWCERFQKTDELVRRALGENALSVEHIGSTSVPGLAAKPIIDVLLTVNNITDEGAYLPRLEAVGFVLRVREPEHRMLRTPARDVHLHVYEPHCTQVRDYLDLRDWLRVSPDDRALYATTKRRLAQQRWRDMNDYADAKTPTDPVGRLLSARGGAAAAAAAPSRLARPSAQARCRSCSRAWRICSPWGPWPAAGRCSSSIAPPATRRLPHDRPGAGLHTDPGISSQRRERR